MTRPTLRPHPTFRPHVTFRAILAGALLTASAHALADPNQDNLDRGEYLVKVAGCNDCHTAGYPDAAGIIPRDQWLIGNPVGFQGPWGTSYPSNLRLLMQEMTQEEWLARARTPMLPPMPWFALRDMSNEDLGAIYAFVRSLGPAGQPAPAAVGPDQAVMTPFIEFVPKNLPLQAGSH